MLSLFTGSYQGKLIDENSQSIYHNYFIPNFDTSTHKLIFPLYLLILMWTQYFEMLQSLQLSKFMLSVKELSLKLSSKESLFYTCL